MKRYRSDTYFNSDQFIDPYTIHTALKYKQIEDLQDKIRHLLPKHSVSRYIKNRETRPNYYNRDYLRRLEAVRALKRQIEALNSGSYNDPFDELYIPPPRSNPPPPPSLYLPPPRYMSTDRYPSKSNLGGKKKSKKLNLKKKTKKSKKINKINKHKKLIKQKN